LMEMSLGLAMGFVVGSRDRLERLPAYAGGAALLAVALVLSNSRGGVFSMVAQFFFFFLVADLSRPNEPAAEAKGRKRSGEGRKRGRGWRKLAARATLAALLLSAVVLGIALVGGDRLVTRLESLPGEAAAGEAGQRLNVSRAKIWKATWQLIKEHPLTGVGFGGYGVAVSKYHDASGELSPEKAHNDYLELLASGGAVGLALGLWFIAAFIVAARKNLRAASAARRPVVVGALTGLCGVAAHSTVDFGLHITANALVFTVLVVLATHDLGRGGESGGGAGPAAPVSQKMPLPGEEMDVDRGARGH
ncbi:MAG TPA: O-antigen ligase family protein, partial [Pyrinomonadaceae bacterium]|nr:O-antigen ligase family protein [Pyrinomonadaceae bacterium]